MKIERTKVYGFESALWGMRNPMNSWDRGDSTIQYLKEPWYENGFLIECDQYPHLGSNDLTLCKKLIKAGEEHRKFLRQINIHVNMTMPRYIWVEFDTYGVGVTRNSCSTMHKLTSRPIEQSDFEDPIPESWLSYLNEVLIDVKEKKAPLTRLKNLLPEGYLQLKTMTINYEAALNIHRQRKNHRLPQWSGEGGICQWIRALPLMETFLEEVG